VRHWAIAAHISSITGCAGRKARGHDPDRLFRMRRIDVVFRGRYVAVGDLRSPPVVAALEIP